MISLMNSPTAVYREEQLYRELPPFTLLAVVGTLFGWFLIIWVVIMGRSLGDLALPTWLALAIGLPLAILLPLVYSRLRMITEVYPDRVSVVNGMAARISLPMADIAEVEIRDDDINDDYNVRNVGAIRNTRIAFTVASNNGVQLSMADGRQFHIGSKDPSALFEAINSGWNVGSPKIAMEV